MPESCLFVGNGPNRLNNGSRSWKALLQDLATFVGQPVVMQDADYKPFPLLFEELSLRCARRGISERELKGHVAGLVDTLRPNEVHRELIDLPFRHVLTTNYDYSLESAAEDRNVSVDLSSESRYSLFRCRETKPNQRVWHLHGEAEKPDTIVLGHDQYVGYLAKIKSYLVPDTFASHDRAAKYRSPVINGRYNCEESGTLYSWVDIFLRDHVHIVGFGLDYSEIGLWWLLGYKERLRLKALRAPKDVSVGGTTFFFFEEDHRSPVERSRLRMLGDMGVNLVSIDRGGDYRLGWNRLVDRLATPT